jgi:hypothetical protein
MPLDRSAILVAVWLLAPSLALPCMADENGAERRLAFANQTVQGGGLDIS